MLPDRTTRSKGGSPLGAGVALLGGAIVALSFRTQRRTLLLVLGLAVMASSPVACGSSGGGGGNLVTIQVIGVNATDIVKTIPINNLPANLGTVSIAGSAAVNPPAATNTPAPGTTPTRTPTP